MSLLSDTTLAARLLDRDSWEPWQRLRVEPFDESMLQPCSIDVHLGTSLKVYVGSFTDTTRDNRDWWETLVMTTRSRDLSERDGWVLQPDRFYLASLAEWITVPEDCCGHLHGVSSRARDGVTVHQTAGLLDPGWEGRATLELTVRNPNTLLFPDQRIAQVTFTQLDHRCTRAYRGRYQGDTEPEPARLFYGLAV